MQTRILTLAIVSGLATGLFAVAPTAQAASAAARASSPLASSPSAQQDMGDSEFAPNDTISCEMDYTLTGWSVFYKSASGNGTVKCSNGRKMNVVLNVTGGGLTFGHYQINDGHGDFTAVSHIGQVLGDYAMATAHAGAVKSTRAMVLTNGDTTLTLTGTGNGWNIGVGFASFSIKRASGVGGTSD